MKASDLAVVVNETLSLVEEDGYSARTMVTWLHKCGFKVKSKKPFAHSMNQVNMQNRLFIKRSWRQKKASTLTAMNGPRL